MRSLRQALLGDSTSQASSKKSITLRNESNKFSNLADKLNDAQMPAIDAEVDANATLQVDIARTELALVTHSTKTGNSTRITTAQNKVKEMTNILREQEIDQGSKRTFEQTSASYVSLQGSIQRSMHQFKKPKAEEEKKSCCSRLFARCKKTSSQDNQPPSSHPPCKSGI